jgi:uncharacterized membrane protein YfcA
VLCLVAFLSGTIDAIAGGGGLIQLPALMVAFPQAPVAMLLATNKLSSIFGTAMATTQFLRRVKVDPRQIIPCAALAFGTSMLGAAAITYADPHAIKPAIALLLLAVLVFVIARPRFGVSESTEHLVTHRMIKSLFVAGAVGFYDGFLGPGTGVFLIMGFVGLLGMNFLSGGANAKVINLTTNIAAVGYFASQGLLDYRLGLPMAVSNIAGGFLGSHLAIIRGSRFVRKIFVFVASLALLRLCYDVFGN